MKKITSRHVTVIVFVCLLLSLCVGQIVKDDHPFSDAERRPLQEKPTLSLDSVTDGEYFEDYEAYLLDQAIFRESFRCLKALSSRYLFLRGDNNGIYRINEHFFKISRLNEDSFEKAGEKIETLSETLSDLNCYYAMIPDKNALIAESSLRPSIDLVKAEEILADTVTKAEAIRLYDRLSLDAYYKTDLHWRQEMLLPIADHLLDKMNNNAVQYSYMQTVLDGFCGVYRGQSALPSEGEPLIYLTTSAFHSVTVENIADGTVMPLYHEDDFASVDPYSLYLGGPQPLLKLTNPQVTNGKTLYLFRDSFGSSFAPLLLCGYSEIYLIDLRYLDSKVLDTYISFQEGQDVLFLYSTHILNESTILR